MSQTTLRAILPEIDRLGEDELLWHYISEDDYDQPLPVRQMNWPQLRQLLTDKTDMTVMNAFRDFATSPQRRLVKLYQRKPDTTPVILKGNRVIDGHHRVVAAILEKRPVSCVNLDDLTGNAPVGAVNDPSDPPPPLTASAKVVERLLL